MHVEQTLTDRVCRHGAVRALATLAAFAGAAVLVAGCGGGGSNTGVANVSTMKTSTSQPSSQAGGAGAGPALSGGGTSSSAGGSSQEIEIAGTLKVSQCMRAHGVPTFPDPNSQGSIQINTSELNPNTPQFDRAQQKCAKYIDSGNAPGPAEQTQFQARALRFAQCMRSHGDPDFPDPASGAASTKIVGPRSKPGPSNDNGLDPNSPIFQKAQKECRSLMRGSAGVPVANP